MTINNKCPLCGLSKSTHTDYGWTLHQEKVLKQGIDF